MYTYRLVKDGKVYAYYTAETLYHANAMARAEYKWASIDHLQKVIYKPELNK